MNYSTIEDEDDDDDDDDDEVVDLLRTAWWNRWEKWKGDDRVVWPDEVYQNSFVFFHLINFK